MIIKTLILKYNDDEDIHTHTGTRRDCFSLNCFCGFLWTANTECAKMVIMRFVFSVMKRCTEVGLFWMVRKSTPSGQASGVHAHSHSHTLEPAHATVSP